MGRRRTRQVGQPGREPRERGPVRLLPGALVLAVAVLAAAGVGQVMDADRFPLRVVQIEGELEHVARADLERAVARAVRGGFFSVDVEAVRRAAESLAWVDAVRVRRVWPDAIHLQVQEQEPLGRWTRGRLVNLRGEVFDPGDAVQPPGLPELSGPEGSARRVVDTYRALHARLRPLEMRLSRLSLSARQAWSAELGGDIELLFGTEHVAARLEKFLRVYPVLSGRGEGGIRRVDLRYAHGLAVLRAGPDQGSVAGGSRRGGRLGAVAGNPGNRGMA